jgi:YD repeat-containing protein
MLVMAFAHPTQALAQQVPSVYTEVRKPALIYQSIGGRFRTPQAAYSAYLALLGPGTPTTKFITSNFRECEGTVEAPQHSIVWGTRTSWCYSYVTLNVPTGELSNPGTDRVVSGGAVCPVGFRHEGGYPSDYPGTNGQTIPYILNSRCERQHPINTSKGQCGRVGNPIEYGNSSKVDDAVDYRSAKGSLMFARRYDSRRPDYRDNTSIEFIRPEVGATTGSAWMLANTGGLLAGFYADFPLLSVSSTEMSLRTFGSDPQLFSWGGSTATSLQAYRKNALVQVGGGWLYFDRDRSEVLVFNALGALRSRHFIGGGSVTHTRNASNQVLLNDAFGRSLTVEYGSDGLPVTLTDPDGKVIQFAADLNKSLLSSVTYQDGSVVGYLWDETALVGPNGGSQNGFLTGRVAETGHRSSYSYGDSGRPTSTEMAGGVNRFNLVDSRNSPHYDGVLSITDPLGSARILNYSVGVDGVSRVVSSNQPAGSGCSAASSAMSYDANGNVASEDDFNGNRTCRAWDLARNTEGIRVEGLGTTMACGDVTGVGAVLPPGARKESRQWHPDWMVEAKVAQPGRVTTSVYNGQADPFNGNAIASCAPSTALLPDGKPIVVLCKKVEQATTDTNGATGFSAALQAGVTNRVWSWTYDAQGQELTARDPRNYTTTKTYHAATTADVTLGDLATVRNAKNQVVENYTKYDKHGNWLSMTDANGVITLRTFDLRQRLKSVKVGARPATTLDYDLAGQLKKLTRPDGSWVGFDYDAAQRQTAAYDNKGNRIDYTLDNAGNRTAESAKDPGGVLKRTLSRAIDPLGRVSTVTGRQ